MKKILFGKAAGAALSALILAFTGCQNPASDGDTYTSVRDTKSYTIGTPVLTVKSYQGVNRVSWLPVSDAKKYDLIRQDNSDGTVKILLAGVVNPASTSAKAPDTIFTYDDIVSVNNLLINGRRYTYKVIAYSGYSINDAAGTTGYTDLLNAGSSAAGEFVDPIPNTEASAAVTANIPDSRTFKVEPPKEADIQVSVRSAIDFAQEYLDVRFQANPVYGYKIFYRLGDITQIAPNGIVGGSTGYQAVYIPDVLTGANETVTGLVSFPLVAGKNTLQIEAFFLGADKDGVRYANTTGTTPAFVENIYYEKAPPVSKVVETSRTVYYPTIDPSFKVSGTYFTGNSPSTTGDPIVNNAVRLSWKNVPEAASYEVYKLATFGVNSPPAAGVVNNSLTVANGEWTSLDISGRKYSKIVTSYVYDSNGNIQTTSGEDLWTVVDTAVETGKTYHYIFVVKSDTGSSLPLLNSILVTGAELISSEKFSASVIWNESEGTYVRLDWTPILDAIYTLTRQEISFDPVFNSGILQTKAAGQGWFTVVGEPVPVSYNSSSAGIGLAMYARDVPDAFKSYRYELTAEKDGVKYKPVYNYINNEPFNNIVDATVAANRSGSTINVTVTVKLTDPNKSYTHLSNYIHVYRRALDSYGTPTGDYVDWKTIQAAQLEAASPKGVIEITDDSADLKAAYKYEYKILLMKNGVLMDNILLPADSSASLVF
jgi:hypothetical protein